MARKPEVLAVAPPLPATDVDFNAFEGAIAAGKTAEEAIAAATPAPPEPVEPVAEPEAPPADAE